MRKLFIALFLLIATLCFFIPMIVLLGAGDHFLSAFIGPVKDAIAQDMLSSGAFPQASVDSVQRFLSSVYNIQGFLMILCFTSYLIMTGLFFVSLSYSLWLAQQIAALKKRFPVSDDHANNK